MAKDKKPPRPRAETPKGFRDYFGADVTERKAMLDAIAARGGRCGFGGMAIAHDPLRYACDLTLAMGKLRCQTAPSSKVA